MESKRDEAVAAGQEGGDAPHLIDLPGEHWALWRWVGLRGAGFPVAGALALGSEALAAAADGVLAADEEVGRQRAAAVETLQQSLASCPEEKRQRRLKIIGRLKKGLAPPAANAAEPEVAGLTAASGEAAAGLARYSASFAAALDHQTAVLRQTAADPRMREAVTWQNRHALASGFEPLLRQASGSPRRGSHDRRNEHLVAAYTCRYSLKNDTIGFFGPVGWARLTDSPAAISARPGADLLAQRKVFFETWCIDAIAEALAGDRPLRPWLTPRKLPFFVQQGDLYIPFQGQPYRLSPAERAVFDACTGARTAIDLAAALSADPALALGSQEAVFAVLAQLAEREMIAWRLEVPMSLAGEEVLAQILARVGDAALREPMLAELAELVERRDAMAAATGDPARLGAALVALEERFEALTGKDSQRLHGLAYAGRSLVYEDCRRDLEVELGGSFLAALGPPLSLVLMSARWLGEEIGRRYREELYRAYAELRDATGQGTVSLVQFIAQIRSTLLAARSPMVAAVAAEHRRRWDAILPLPAGVRRVQFDSARLRPLVEEAFRASGPGWLRARQHSPDVLVRAESVEAIQRGELQFVLGELHFATNTLGSASFLSQHPSPEDLRQAQRRDIPEPTVVPWLFKRREVGGQAKNPLGLDIQGANARLAFSLASAKDLRLALDVDPPADPGVTTFFPGDFVVTERAGEVVVASRDGAHCMEILNFFEIAISAQSTNEFRILPSKPYTPRVTIDRLIVHREMWRTPLAAETFPVAKTEDERFLAARRYMRRHGMPRFVFVRTPYENKPFFVDFASPVAVEILARACRRALDKGGAEARIGVSEMVPEPDQAWLPDAEGRRYTSELRFVAVDRLADAPRQAPAGAG